MHNPLDPQLILATLLYSLIGVAVFGLAFWVMVKATPFSIRKEIEEDQNVALGLVVASVIVGLAMIISASLSS